MKQIVDAILKDMLPTIQLRMIAGAIAPLLAAAWAFPNLLEEIGIQIPPQQKPLLLTSLLVLVLFLWLIVLQHRSFRLSSEQFTEYRGAFFKLNSSGGYHEAVYCGVCKSPTARASKVPFLDEPFICKCGWKSNFNLGDFNDFFPTLEP